MMMCRQAGRRQIPTYRHGIRHAPDERHMIAFGQLHEVRCCLQADPVSLPRCQAFAAEREVQSVVSACSLTVHCSRLPRRESATLTWHPTGQRSLLTT